MRKKRGVVPLMGNTFKNTVTSRVKIPHFYILLSLTPNTFSGKYSSKKKRNIFLKFYHFLWLVFFPTKFSLGDYYLNLMIPRTKQRFKRNIDTILSFECYFEFHTHFALNVFQQDLEQ